MNIYINSDGFPEYSEALGEVRIINIYLYNNIIGQIAVSRPRKSLIWELSIEQEKNFKPFLLYYLEEIAQEKMKRWKYLTWFIKKAPKKIMNEELPFMFQKKHAIFLVHLLKPTSITVAQE